MHTNQSGRKCRRVAEPHKRNLHRSNPPLLPNFTRNRPREWAGLEHVEMNSQGSVGAEIGKRGHTWRTSLLDWGIRILKGQHGKVKAGFKGSHPAT